LDRAGSSLILSAKLSSIASADMSWSDPIAKVLPIDDSTLRVTSGDAIEQADMRSAFYRLCEIAIALG